MTRSGFFFLAQHESHQMNRMEQEVSTGMAQQNLFHKKRRVNVVITEEQ
jgi:hypothetical protein